MAVMTSEGAHIKQRRERLTFDRIQLAQEAGVSVDTLRDLEEGTTRTPRGSTVAKIVQALDRLEDEAGLNTPPAVSELPPAGTVEFEITGDFGVRIVARAPVSDSEALEKAVARLVRDIRERRDDEA